MTILIIGGLGFIATNLRLRLQRDGHTVGWIGRDLKRMEGLAPLAANQPIDAIINCAGQMTDPGRMWYDNVVNTVCTLDIARAKGIPKVIHIGSSSELGHVEGVRSEDMPCNPSNMYESTKLAATDMCIGYASEYSLDISIARPFTTYGPHQKARMILPTLWRAWKDGTPFHCYPGGHDWIHVDDFIEGIISLLHAPAAVTRGQVFHFGTGISTSNARIVELFNEAAGSGGVDVVHHKELYHPYDVSDWRASTDKAARQLGWRARISIEKGVRRCVNELWFEEDKG